MPSIDEGETLTMLEHMSPVIGLQYGRLGLKYLHWAWAYVSFISILLCLRSLTVEVEMIAFTEHVNATEVKHT